MIGKRFFDWRQPLNYREMFAITIGVVIGILIAMWLGELGESIFSKGWTETWN